MTWQWYLNYDNSFMVDVFVGQLKSSLKCAKCGYISNTFDPFWEIPLPLKKVCCPVLAVSNNFVCNVVSACK